MPEGELPRVQRLAREALLAAPAIDRIALDRMLDRGEVHADLVRAPGLELALEQRVAGESLLHAVVRGRGLAAGDDRHARALGRMPTDGLVDGAVGGDLAACEREVGALHGARLQLAHE